jgi:hypothetical protein
VFGHNHPEGTGFKDVREWVYLMNGVLHFLRYQFGLPNLAMLLRFVTQHILFQTQPK